MERLRLVLAKIGATLSGLTATQKLLIGSLAVIMLMGLFLVSQYAGRQQFVEVWPGAAAADQQRAITFLAATSMGVRDTGGRAMVPVENRTAAQGLLAQAGQSPADATLVFENLVKNRNWMATREENRQTFRLALQNELAGVLARFSDISRATVFLDTPEPTGIGQAVRKPTASITLFTRGGGPLGQQTVDAAARLVAGAVAGLEVSRVAVTDGTAKQSRRPSGDDDAMPTAYREAAAKVEQQFRDKISNMLSYIRGVGVEVTASVDVRRAQHEELQHLEPKKGTVSLPKRENGTTQEQNEASGGAAEPGVRSNQGADIRTGAASSGSKNNQSTSETEFQNAIGQRRESVIDPRGMPTRLVASITVPRSYVRAQLEGAASAAAGAAGGTGGGAAPAAISDADIQTRFDTVEKKAIESAVSPHLRTQAGDGSTADGQVVVTLVSDPGGMEGAGSGNSAAGLGAAGAGGAGGGTIGTILSMGKGMIDTIVLGVLAAAALGLMMMMVRRSGKRAELPTAEEIVGLPPALPTDSDLVGEAEESETPIEGIEIDDDQMKAEKLRQQVSGLIKQTPDVAAKVLNRWIAVER